MDHCFYISPIQQEQEEEEEEANIYTEDVCSNTEDGAGDEVLIDTVKSYPHIYNKTLKEYKDKGLQDET